MKTLLKLKISLITLFALMVSIVAPSISYWETWSDAAQFSADLNIATTSTFGFDQSALDLDTEIILQWTIPWTSYISWYIISESVWGTWTRVFSGANLLFPTALGFTVPQPLTWGTAYTYKIETYISSWWTITSQSTCWWGSDCQLTVTYEDSPNLAGFCDTGNAYVSNAPVTFSRTWEWKKTDIVITSWKDYSTSVYDLWESNKPWQVSASYKTFTAAAWTYNITWNDPWKAPQIAANENTAWYDDRVITFNTYLVDNVWRAVVNNTAVNVIVDNVDKGALVWWTTTDWLRSWTYTFPTSDFSDSADVEKVVKLKSWLYESAPYTVTLKKKWAAINIPDWWWWISLIDKEIWPNEQFTVPININVTPPGGAKWNAYQVNVIFDDTRFEYFSIAKWPWFWWTPTANLVWTDKVLILATDSAWVSWNSNVASVTFKVKPWAPTWIGEITWFIDYVEDGNWAPFINATKGVQTMVIKDAAYTGLSIDYVWWVTVRTVWERWMRAYAWEYQLFNTEPITWVNDETQISVTRYRNNYSNLNITTTATCTVTNWTSIEVDAWWTNCLVRAIWQWTSEVTVTDWSDSTVLYFNVYHYTWEYDLVYDDYLQYIVPLAPQYQTTRPEFKVKFSDWPNNVWVNMMDVDNDGTDDVDVEVAWNFSYSNRTVSVVSAWWTGTIRIKKKWTSTVLKTWNLQETWDTGHDAVVSRIGVLLPKSISTSMAWLSFLPWSVTEKKATSYIISQLTTPTDSLQAYAQLEFDDWFYQTIDNSLIDYSAAFSSWTSIIDAEDVLSVTWTTTIIVSPNASWLWVVKAALKSDAGVTWNAKTCARLPDPNGIVLPITEKIISVNSIDPINSHKGLSNYYDITNVTLTYSGSAFTQNVYARAWTTYEITSWSWIFVLTWALNNRIQGVGNWFTETWEVKVTYWAFTDTITVKVRWVTNITIDPLKEHYGQSNPDDTLNLIEDTGVYQNIYAIVKEHYSAWYGSSIISIPDGTLVTNSTDSPANLKFNNTTKNMLEVPAWWVTGSYIIRYNSWPFTATASVVVSDTKVDVTALNLSRWVLADFVWTKWSTQKWIGWSVTFSDWARRMIFWSDASIWKFIPGFFEFSENTAWAVATMNPTTWVATLQWNGASEFKAQIANDMNIGTWVTVWTWNVIGNLNPYESWDMDFWIATWIPLIWVTNWAEFDVPVRLFIPSSTTLSSIQLEVYYDPLKLEFVSWYQVISNGALKSSTFSIWSFNTKDMPWWLKAVMINWTETDKAQTIYSNKDLVSLTFRASTSDLTSATLSWQTIELGNWASEIFKTNFVTKAWKTSFIYDVWQFAYNKIMDEDDSSKSYANIFLSWAEWIFAKLLWFFKWLFEVWDELVQDTNSLKANIFESAYVSSWGSLPQIWDINNSCSVSPADAFAVIQFWAKILTGLSPRELILWDVLPVWQQPWVKSGDISWADALYIVEASWYSKHFLQWITYKANASWDVTLRAYIINKDAEPVINNAASDLDVQFEVTPLWAGWTWELIDLTNNWVDPYWKVTITGASVTWWVVLHMVENKTTATAQKVAMKFSKIISPTMDFTPIAVYSNEDTQGNYNTIFWGFYPVNALVSPCDDDTKNFPPTDVSLSSTSVASWSLAWTIIWWFTTTDWDAWDSHTYELINWYWDNADFEILWNKLKLATWSRDWTYNIRVRTIDDWAADLTNVLWFDKQLTLTSWPPAVEPSVFDIANTINEEQIYQFNKSDFTWAYLAWASWAALSSIQILSLPTNGRIYSWAVSYTWLSLIWSWVELIGSWTQITSTGLIIASLDDIGNYYYVPDVDYDESDSFQWLWYDWTNWSQVEANVWFNITVIPDTPTVWSGQALENFSSSWIYITKNANDTNSQIIFYKITNIIWGTLNKLNNDLVADWDFITKEDWVDGLLFTPNSWNDWSFDVQAAGWSWDSFLSDQSAVVTSNIEVTAAWDVTCWFNLSTVEFTWTAAQASNFRMYYDMETVSWSYFWCEDLRGSSEWWWDFKIGISDLTKSWATSTAFTLWADTKIKIYHSDSYNVVTDAIQIYTWSYPQSANIFSTLEKGYSNGKFFDIWNQESLLNIVSYSSWSDEQWAYKIRPTISVDVPAYQAVGTYTGVITLDLDKNVAWQ